MTDILMPALSPTMEEGTLSKWNVKAGDSVKSGDVIAEIETDKATMEVEAVDEGVVEAILVPEGTEGVKVNTPIARLKGEGEGEADIAPGEPPQSSAPQPTAPPGGEHRPADPPRQGEGDPAKRGGGGSSGEAAAQTSPSRVQTESDKPEEGARGARDGSAGETREARLQGEKPQRVPAPTASAAGTAQPSPPPSGERIFASPLARRLAEQKGVPLSAIKGSGPHGRIVKADVDAFQPSAAPQPAAAPDAAPPSVAAQPQGTAPQPAAPAPAEAPRAPRTLEQMGIAPGSYDLTPLDGMRKTVARRLTDSFRDVPHFPLTIDIELDELLAFRGKLNKRLDAQGVKVSVNDILIKCSALALMAEPDANASFTPEGIARHHHADVAVAVAIDGGLITPIIRSAETRGLADISRTMKDLAERARTRKLKPEEYQGGTFSISNLGMFGIRQFSSIINEPQGMILSVGAGDKRPVVRSSKDGGDQLAVATVMTVTLTCDHRVVDGAIGARWLTTFRGLVEDPITMLA